MIREETKLNWPRKVETEKAEIAGGSENHSILQIHTGCGETFFAGPNGTVSSPNYPGTFPPFTNCTYTIQVEPGQTVYLVFDFMQLQYGTMLAGIQDEDCLSAVTNMGAPAVLSVFDGGTTSNDSFIDA